MKITEILRNGQPMFSLEFFPPKTDEGMIQLFHTLGEVKKLNPGYISVTYGAGGSTREKTFEIVKRAKHEIGIEAMAHLTCVAHSKQEIKAILDEFVASGIENIIALRGDPPKGETTFIPNPEGFAHANELTTFIHDSYPLCIGVAGYPEGHIESPDKGTDWNFLLQKVKAGADFIITQLFFENQYFYAFEKAMREKGVKIPIIPGIMPITNYRQIVKFTQMCGATIPEQVLKGLEGMQDDVTAVQQYGVELATRQCKELIAHGVPGIHFYTLNKSTSTQEIIQRLTE